jgi:hypothetical protein
VCCAHAFFPCLPARVHELNRPSQERGGDTTCRFDETGTDSFCQRWDATVHDCVWCSQVCCQLMQVGGRLCQSSSQVFCQCFLTDTVSALHVDCHQLRG